MTMYSNWRDVPPLMFPWRNFSPAEIACRGTGRVLIDDEAMTKLQKLRDTVGKPLIVTSAYRSPEHNARVGGARNSMHLTGKAFDISMSNHDPEMFIRMAKQCGFTGIGTYPKQNFVHIDTGPKRTWGSPFPSRRGTVFASDAPEPPPKPPVAVASAGAAGATAVGAEPMARAVSVVAEQQGEFTSGDMVRVAVALLIVGLTLYFALRVPSLGD